MEPHSSMSDAHKSNSAEKRDLDQPQKLLKPKSAADSSTSLLLSLPADMRVFLACFLDGATICTLAGVCKALNREMSENHLVWENCLRLVYGISPEAQLIEPNPQKCALLERYPSIDHNPSRRRAKTVPLSLRDLTRLAVVEATQPTKLSLHNPWLGDDVHVGLEVRQLDDMAVQMRNEVDIGGDRCVTGDQMFPLLRRPLARLRMECVGENVFQPNASPVEYFEITVGERSRVIHGTTPECVSIGLSESICKLQSQQPGWVKRSWGYHSDDGYVYHDRCVKWARLSTFNETGATVGCGYIRYDYGTIVLFFIDKNGDFQMKVARSMKPLRAIIGLDSHRKVTANFGRKKPFVHDYTKAISLFTKQIGRGDSDAFLFHLRNYQDSPTNKIFGNNTRGNSNSTAAPPWTMSPWDRPPWVRRG